MSEFKITSITNRDGSHGPQICGIVTFTGSGLTLPSGGLAGPRGRGITGGGYPSYRNFMNKIEIATKGDAIDFGDITKELRGPSDGVSSSTRGLFGGGLVAPNNASQTVISYVVISSEGGANDFGDLTRDRFMIKGHSNNTRGIFTGGYAVQPSVHVDNIDFVNIASTGDANDFGDISASPPRSTFGSGSSPTRGVFGGGYYGAPGTDVADIEFITFATQGNSETFASLSAARRNLGGVSSSTRALFAGGNNGSGTSNNNTIDYVTIATTGNTTDFGDMTGGGRNRPAGLSNSIRGCFAGGRIGGSSQDSITFVTIASTGNSADFGDLTYAGFEIGGVSDAHGGLAT